MKNSMLISVATMILCFGFQVSLSAQRTATWKGGTPGKISDWNCPTNWKEGRVPDEFSNVVIPDVSTSTFSYPIINSEVEIFSLICDAPARLKILDGGGLTVLQLITDEQSTRNDSFAEFGNHIKNLTRIQK